MKSDLNELKNNFNEMKSISNMREKLRNSFENLVDTEDNQPLVTFPDDSPCVSEISSPTNQVDTLKFEQKTMNNFKKTKVTDEVFMLIIRLKFEFRVVLGGKGWTNCRKSKCKLC